MVDDSPLSKGRLSGRALRDTLQNQIGQYFWPDATISAIGKLHTSVLDDGTHLCLIEIGGSRKGVRFSETLILAELPSGPVAELPPLVFASADLGLQATLFPHDLRLPGLSSAIEGRFSNVAWRHPVPVIAEADLEHHSQILRYRPWERCVIHHSWRSGKTEFQAVTKTFAAPDQALSVWRTLTGLLNHLPEAAFVVEPLALDEGTNTVILEYVKGDSLGKRLDTATDDANRNALITLAAKALASIHAIPELPDERREASALSEKGLRDSLLLLHWLPRELTLRVQAVLDVIENGLSVNSDNLKCFVHGGFKPAQLLLHEGQVTLVDFDGSGQGDPGLDVGRFMAKLRYDSLDPSKAHLVGSDEQFLTSYLRFSTWDVFASSRLWQAVAFLRMALRRIETTIRHRDSRIIVETERLVLEAERIINGTSVMPGRP